MRKLITTDSHLVPPPWLLNELPERLRGKVTGQLMTFAERDGKRYVQFPERLSQMMSEAGMPAEIEVESDEMLVKLLHLTITNGVDATPWFEPEGRLIDMERENVVGAVLIGNPIFGLRRGAEETEAQIAWCRLVNDWLADTYKHHLGQFAPGAYLPYLDPAACAVELERAAGLGLRPGLLPDGIWDDPYWQPHWEPLWEAAAGLGVPLTMHIAAIRNEEAAKRDMPPPPAYAGTMFEGFYGLSCEMGKTLMQLTFSGVFQRHPDLHVVMTEGYAFWLAGAMQFCDHHWEGRFGASSRQMIELDAPPSYFMKRQAHATFMWDPVAINNRGFTGTDCLLWGNDYPHAEGVFPDSQAFVEKQFAGVPEDEVERMTFSKARSLFKFDV